MTNVTERIEELEIKLDSLLRRSKELLTIEEVTELFGWSRRKIFQMRDEGILKFYRFPNTRRRYMKRSEIESTFTQDELVEAA